MSDRNKETIDKYIYIILFMELETTQKDDDINLLTDDENKIDITDINAENSLLDICLFLKELYDYKFDLKNMTDNQKYLCLKYNIISYKYMYFLLYLNYIDPLKEHRYDKYINIFSLKSNVENENPLFNFYLNVIANSKDSANSRFIVTFRNMSYTIRHYYEYKNWQIIEKINCNSETMFNVSITPYLFIYIYSLSTNGGIDIFQTLSEKFKKYYTALGDEINSSDHSKKITRQQDAKNIVSKKNRDYKEKLKNYFDFTTFSEPIIQQLTLMYAHSLEIEGSELFKYDYNDICSSFEAFWTVFRSSDLAQYYNKVVEDNLKNYIEKINGVDQKELKIQVIPTTAEFRFQKPSLIHRIISLFKNHPKITFGIILAIIAVFLIIFLLIPAIKKWTSPSLLLNMSNSSLNVPNVGVNSNFKPVLTQSGSDIFFGPPGAQGSGNISNLCFDLAPDQQKNIVQTYTISLEFDLSNYSPDKITITLVEMAAVDYCIVSVNDSPQANYPQSNDQANPILFTSVSVGTDLNLPLILNNNITSTNLPVSRPASSGSIVSYNLKLSNLKSGVNNIKFNVGTIGAGNLYFYLKYSVAS